ncbi:Os01g0608000, partial [Oryza sativa Japonica Group]
KRTRLALDVYRGIADFGSFTLKERRTGGGG